MNQSFVQRILGGRNPIGRRVRCLPANREGTASADAPENAWHEIVGVVRDLGMIHDDPHDLAGVYNPELPGATSPMYLVVHISRDPASAAESLRTAAAAVDPTLRVHELLPLDKAGAGMWNEFDFLFWLLILVSGIALLLSLAGIYAVMSFAVSRRTREIGIRIALGAEPRRLVMVIFRRPLVQLGLGVVAGAALVAALSLDAFQGALGVTEAAVLVAYAAVMIGVCLLACIVPARRALKVEPTEALRAGY